MCTTRTHNEGTRVVPGLSEKEVATQSRTQGVVSDRGAKPMAISGRPQKAALETQGILAAIDIGGFIREMPGSDHFFEWTGPPLLLSEEGSTMQGMF